LPSTGPAQGQRGNEQECRARPGMLHGTHGRDPTLPVPCARSSVMTEQVCSVMDVHPAILASPARTDIASARILGRAVPILPAPRFAHDVLPAGCPRL